MRKWIAMTLACLLILGQVALAAVPDVSTLTDEEYQELINEIKKYL